MAFGRFFPSQTKPDAILATAELLLEAKATLQIPVVAIGGIDAGNGKLLVDHGADLLAVIHSVLGAPDIEQAATTIAALFSPTK